MSLEKELSLTAHKRPAVTDRTVLRRSRVIDAINDQVEVIRAMTGGESVAKPPRSKMKWWWSDGSRYYCAVYYARNPLELAKGKYSAQCVDLHGVSNALNSIAKAIDRGEFDEQMRVIAGEVRVKFSNRRNGL